MDWRKRDILGEVRLVIGVVATETEDGGFDEGTDVWVDDDDELMADADGVEDSLAWRARRCFLMVSVGTAEFGSERD